MSFASKAAVAVGSTMAAEPGGPHVGNHMIPKSDALLSTRENGQSAVDRAQGLVAAPDLPLIVSSASRPPASTASIPPSSIDGKSTNSITTFAMDEKESIRPDDSASMKAAVDDEDSASALGNGAPGFSQISDVGTRAFGQQLQEISEHDMHSPSLAAFNDPSSLHSATYIPLAPDGTPLHDPTPDVKLLDALESPRDRIWVLKLEQDIIDFIKDTKETSLVLPQCNSFYRMLAHKLGDYYLLGHAVDETNSFVRLFKTSASRIPRPLTGVVTPSTAASTPPPSTMQMKILRRNIDGVGPALANGSNCRSKNTSENSESSTEDDSKKSFTREEREARYEAARLRIMGSAKPLEPLDISKEKDDSRSSSVTGRRRKKQPRDSDDDFEARSAYNSYVTPQAPLVTSLSPIGYAAPYALPLSPASHGSFEFPSGAQQGYWYPQPIQSVDQDWQQQAHQQYELSRDFDRMMSFQPQQVYPMHQQQQTHSVYEQSAYPAGAYVWQPGVQVIQHTPQQAFATQSYQQQQQPSEPARTQTYAYGQLPSQALGHPPNALEHPLPGSYKSRHFNPQSLTFVPNPGNGDHHQLYSPQRPHFSSSHGVDLLERQLSSHSQSSHIDSPLRANGPSNGRIHIPPSLTHPLPQPVFPSHQMPSTVLPPKPSTTHSTSQILHGGQNSPQAGGESTLAKWGTPASLPAKPPPIASVDVSESSKTPLLPQRSTNGLMSPRMPIFGSMPPS